MKDRHILLNNWMYEVVISTKVASIMELKGEQAVYNYIVDEFQKDIQKTFAQMSKEISITKEKS